MGIPLWKGPSTTTTTTTTTRADKTLGPRIARRARSSGTLLEILRRGADGALDGLGDRERSLSPDSQWEVMASNVGLVTACDEVWDEEDEAGEEDEAEEMRVRIRYREARATEDGRRRQVLRAMARSSRARYERERLEPYQDLLEGSRRRFEESLSRGPLTQRVAQSVVAHQSVMTPALQELIRGREERL